MSVPPLTDSPLGQRTEYTYSYPYTRKDLDHMQAILTDMTINGEYAMRWIYEDATRITISSTESFK